ncbi:MAG: hypothetical protein IT569_09645 [Leptospiraceae bacterium]|nr:hypothetical protein [Leptospiraceae bacterium]
MEKRTWKERGLQFAKDGDSINAISAFRNSLRENVNDPLVWKRLGEIFEKANRRFEALKSYKASIRKKEINPEGDTALKYALKYSEENDFRLLTILKHYGAKK